MTQKARADITYLRVLGVPSEPEAGKAGTHADVDMGGGL